MLSLYGCMLLIEGGPESRYVWELVYDDSEGSDVFDAPNESTGLVSTLSTAGYSPSCPIVGGTHTNFKRVHAEQGHVFVVAASHLIFRFLQPLQARITEDRLVIRRNEVKSTIGQTYL